MEKQILYVKVNEEMTARIVLDSPVPIGDVLKKLDAVSSVNKSSMSSIQEQEEQI